MVYNRTWKRSVAYFSGSGIGSGVENVQKIGIGSLICIISSCMYQYLRIIIMAKHVSKLFYLTSQLFLAGAKHESKLMIQLK